MAQNTFSQCISKQVQLCLLIGQLLMDKLKLYIPALFQRWSVTILRCLVSKLFARFSSMSRTKPDVNQVAAESMTNLKRVATYCLLMSKTHFVIDSCICAASE